MIILAVSAWVIGFVFGFAIGQLVEAKEQTKIAERRRAELSAIRAGK